MTCYSTKYPVSTAFKLRFKEIFARRRNGSSNFLSRQPPVGASRW
jgi:hypothetical protein